MRPSWLTRAPNHEEYMARPKKEPWVNKDALRQAWQAARRTISSSSVGQRVAIVLALIVVVASCALSGVLRLPESGQPSAVNQRRATATPTLNTLPPLTGAILGGQLAALQTTYPPLKGISGYAAIISGTKARMDVVESAGTDGQKHLASIRLRPLDGAKPFTFDQAIALLQQFIPPDSRHDKDLSLRTGTVEHIYWNGNLAATFPAASFHNVASALVTPGTFALILEHDEEDVGTNDCRIAIGVN